MTVVLTAGWPLRKSRHQRDRAESTDTLMREAHRPNSVRYQVAATLAVSAGPLAVGLAKGFISPALLSLAAPPADGGLALTPQQSSWVASLSLLGALVGTIPAGLALRSGRRRLLAAVCVPFAAAWWLAAAAADATQLFVAAFVSGACSAVISLVTPIYVSEISRPEVRGGLCAAARAAGSLGLLLALTAGAWLSWRRLALLASAGPLLLLLACCVWLPETPSHLLSKGQEQQARMALQRLRGPREDIGEEFCVVRANVLYGHPVRSMGAVGYRDLARPLFITCGLMLLQKFSGAHAFGVYTVPLLSRTLAGPGAHGAAAAAAALQLLAGAAAGLLVDTAGRRPLLMGSSLLTAAAMAGLGLLAWLRPGLDWLPVTCALLVQVAATLGAGSLSGLLLAELFPLRARGLSAVASAVSYAGAFVSTKSLVDLEQALGLPATFCCYAGVAVLCAAFVALFVPETRGCELDEMSRQSEFV